MEILLAVFVMLQVLDFYTTKTILDAGGVEKNPIMRWLTERLGLDEALVIAKGAAVGAGAALYSYGAYTPLALITILYLGVIIYNQRSMP